MAGFRFDQEDPNQLEGAVPTSGESSDTGDVPPLLARPPEGGSLAAPGPACGGRPFLSGVAPRSAPARGLKVEPLASNDPVLLDADAKTEAARLAGVSPGETTTDQQERADIAKAVTGDPDLKFEDLAPEGQSPESKQHSYGFKLGGEKTVDFKSGLVKTQSELAANLSYGPGGWNASLTGNDGSLALPGKKAAGDKKAAGEKKVAPHVASFGSFSIGARGGGPGGLGLNASVSAGESTDGPRTGKGPSAQLELGNQGGGRSAFLVKGSLGEVGLRGPQRGVTLKAPNTELGVGFQDGKPSKLEVPELLSLETDKRGQLKKLGVGPFSVEQLKNGRQKVGYGSVDVESQGSKKEVY